MSMTNEVVFITGASRGIGAAAVRLFASHGARIAAAARSATQLDQLATDIERAGGQCLAVPCDVADMDSVNGAFAAVEAALGPVTILVNNAGVIDPVSRIDESDPGQWGAAIDINLKGVYYCARAALSHMLPGKQGVIINISSGAATNALEGWSHYCASKAGVLALTRCVHKEYADHGIRAVGLSPGTVATDMQVVIRESGVNPVSQLDPDVHIPPEWVAQALVWLCSGDARQFDGGDFSLKTDEGRRLVGLPSISS